MDLKIAKQQQNTEILIHLSGEIDAFTTPKLKEELLSLAEGDNQVIIVNLQDVTYLDSTGLGIFVNLFKRLDKNNGELRLIELSERVHRLFEITGLSRIMSISVNSECGGR